MGEANTKQNNHKMSKYIEMIKTRVIIKDQHLINFRKPESRQDEFRDNPQQRKLQLRTRKRDVALQRQQSFGAQCHSTPCLETVKRRHDLWLIVTSQVEVYLKVCLLNSYSWNTKTHTPPPAHPYP